MTEDSPKQEITKELVEELMKTKGEVRGLLVKNDGDYILKERGNKDLEKVEEELKKWGLPVKYKDIKSLDFYPVGLRAVSLLAIKKTFDFDDEKIREVVSLHPKQPLSMKLFMRLYSVPKIVKRIQSIWGRMYTVGEVVFTKFDEKEKHGILEIRGFDVHPIICRAMEGHTIALAKMVLNAEKATCWETKCTFKGHDCHEFQIAWE